MLLLLQQSKYYKSLSDKTPQRRNCGDCGAPTGEGDDGGEDKKKKCINPDFDEKSTTMGKFKSIVGNKVRKAFNAEKSDSRMKE